MQSQILLIACCLNPNLALRLRAAEMPPQQQKALVTTAYFTTKSKLGDPNKSEQLYVSQMGPVMRLNSSMLVYGNNHSLPLMMEARGQREPALLGARTTEIEMLPPCSIKPMLYENPTNYTHQLHVPSVELGCIWSGKLTLMMQSMRDYPDYHWHIWLDVGMHDGARKLLAEHADKPWPDTSKLQQLPDGKMIAAHSHDFDCTQCVGWDYCHCVSGMGYVVPGTLLPRMLKLFSKYQAQCFQSLESSGSAFPCMSDQVVFTRIAQDHPDLFHFIGTEKQYAAVVVDISRKSQFESSGIGFWIDALTR